MPYGTVKSRKGEFATVVLERQDMCGECHACEMLSGKKECTLQCSCQIPCETGDQVEIMLTNDRFLKATYMMYGIPLLGFIGGLFLGYGIGGLLGTMAEGGGMIGAVLGTAAGFLFIKLKEKKKVFQKYLPKIISKK